MKGKWSVDRDLSSGLLRGSSMYTKRRRDDESYLGRG